mgnify:CR=1 FL=1
MGRILFFVLLAALIWIAWTFQRRQRIRERQMSERLRELEKQQESRSGGASKEETAMAQCEHCGVYFPKSEAVVADGHVFCSEVCRQRAGR